MSNKNSKQEANQQKPTHIPMLVLNGAVIGDYDLEALQSAKEIHEFAENFGLKMRPFSDLENRFGFYITDGISKGISIIELIRTMSKRHKEVIERLEKVVFMLEKQQQ